MFELKDKTALITGATGGIGAALARALYAQGATLAISGRQTAKLEALAAELGARVHICPCDLADRAAVAKLIEEAVGKLGRLDILLNNAGLTRDNLFMVMKDEQWDEVIAVNLTSTFMLMRAAARAMMRARTGYGRIINISSISGVIGNPGQGNYAASKAGMIGMSKSLAREVASRGITVNTVSAGAVGTDVWQAMPDGGAALARGRGDTESRHTQPQPARAGGSNARHGDALRHRAGARAGALRSAPAARAARDLGR